MGKHIAAFRHVLNENTVLNTMNIASANTQLLSRSHHDHHQAARMRAMALSSMWIAISKST
jgi:hypothetical protein